MRNLLIIGCGDVALRAIPLLARRYRLFALVRNPLNLAKLRALNVMPLVGDLDDRASLARLSGLADAVLHFAPPANSAPRPESGQGMFSATDMRTCNLLSALSQGRLPTRMVYISTSGVYGDCAGEWVSETHRLNATSARAQRRVDAEQQVLHWAKSNRVNASILRVPGIYAAERLPLSRLQQGTPGIIASEDSYTNHIHADDLARISVAALRYGKPGRVYNASDDSQLKMCDYFDAVADAHALPRMARLPRAAVKQMVSPLLWSFMSESRRMINTRMKQELKVKLHYPQVQSLLSQIG